MARSVWAWGAEPTEEEKSALAAQVAIVLGGEVPRLSGRAGDTRVRASRASIDLPFVTADDDARARRTYGRSFPEVRRAFDGDFGDAPDCVATPSCEEELARLLERTTMPLVPRGGGTSVVRGVTFEGEGPWCSVDLGAMDAVLEIDDVSLAARVQAGAVGPRIEEQLGALSMRFYPQSFERATLGGFIATRAAGHWATGPTHIDDLVESVRVVGPTGAWSTRRLPASGAGPDPNRLVLGSEGALGFVTEAWVRLVRRPRFKAQASVLFEREEDAIDAVRAVVQSGLRPANVRLLDAREAMMNGVAQSPIVLLGFESADHDVREPMQRAIKLTRGTLAGDVVYTARDGRAGSWRSSFLRGPHLQSVLVSLGLVVDTFETACTWDRTRELARAARGAVMDAFAARGARGVVTMRFTHAYPDGVAPYFTFVGTAGSDAIETWSRVKRAASDAVIAAGGTITHHHAVGRLHREHWLREVPEPFVASLRAARRVLDPRGILNPGIF